MTPGHSRAETQAIFNIIKRRSWREQALKFLKYELETWEVYSLGGTRELELFESMKISFTQYRTGKIKKTKSACTNHTFTLSWCAFIRRWNSSRRKGMSFTSWRLRREDTHGGKFIANLRRRVCRLNHDEFHMCYVHVRKGPHRVTWRDHVRFSGNVTAWCCAHSILSTSNN